MKTTLLRNIPTLALVFAAIILTNSVDARENKGQPVVKNETQRTTAGCIPSTAQIDLQVNNVRAGLLSGGDMWWDLNDPQYEVPVGSNKNSMFTGSLWIGGIDVGGNINVAAQTYRQTGIDYWPGTMDTSIVDIDASRCMFYDRFWKVSRQEVADLIANGTTTPDILSWPGNGDPVYNEGHFLAPFNDVNGNGNYEPAAGDYPYFNMSLSFPTIPGSTTPFCTGYLYGDEVIWWVINDVGNIHTETSSDPVGIEIRCQAFAYQSTRPSINNATMYNYEMINRSSMTYTDMYFGQWADPDLGSPTDDFVGCDVNRGLGYCYNGDANDDGSLGYGVDPPAIGIDFLQGPIADVGDGIDNDRDGCVDCTYLDSAGVTVTIPDNVYGEQIIMSKFVYYNNINNTPTGNPIQFADYYNYLRGYWIDNQQISYGGDGRVGTPGNTGVTCDFMFPNNTDPLFQTPTYPPWTEVSSGNVPEDRRFLMSAGPFTMQPGEVNYITSAVIWARQPGGGQTGSLALVGLYSDTIQSFFETCFDPFTVGLSENLSFLDFSIYPNPASEIVNFNLQEIEGDLLLQVFDLKGNVVLDRNIHGKQIFTWDVSAFPKGVYLYQFKNNSGALTSGKILIH